MILICVMFILTCRIPSSECPRIRNGLFLISWRQPTAEDNQRSAR